MGAAQFLHDFGEIVYQGLQEKGIEVSFHADEAAEWFLADARALHQVLLNIVVNSADSLEGRPQPKIDIGILRREDRILMRVGGNGCGLNEDQKKPSSGRSIPQIRRARDSVW